MIKLPEPNIKACHCHSTEQLKQYGRDLLEEALNLVNTNNFYETVEKLRALIKEITE